MIAGRYRCARRFFYRRAILESLVPSKPARPCKIPTCPKLTLDKTGFCADHAHLYVPFIRQKDRRQSSTRRGYDRTWRATRERILLLYGIPRDRWPEYDVDHVPAYNPAIEPDHTKYQLIPRLHADHSRKTVREDGGWGRPKVQRGRGDESLGPSRVDRLDESCFHTTKMPGGEF
jgi:5-methylcytosine-specific restriction protein A